MSVLIDCPRCGKLTTSDTEYDYGLCGECHAQGREADARRETQRERELHRGDAERMVIEWDQCIICGWPIDQCKCGDETKRMRSDAIS